MPEDAGGLLGALFARAVDLGREEPRPALTLTHHRKGLDWGRGGRGVALGGVGYGNYSMDLYFCGVAGHATSGNLRPTFGGGFLCASGAKTVSNLSCTLCDTAATPRGVSSELGNDPSAAQRPNAPASRSPRVQTRSFER